MYCADNGRPNRAVQTVLWVRLLKEMFNLTDDEALDQLVVEFQRASASTARLHAAIRGCRWDEAAKSVTVE